MRLFRRRKKYECQEGFSLVPIPNNCYVETPGIGHSALYEVYYDGRSVKDVYGLIRYGNWDDCCCKKDKKITNWKKELGD